MSSTITPSASAVKPQIVVYTNSPPVKRDAVTRELVENMSGGAVRVVLETGAKVWIGPGDVIPDHEYDKLTQAQKFPLDPAHYQGQKPGDPLVFRFPVPETLKRDQYEVVSNSLLWPMHHSMNPLEFTNPSLAHVQRVVPEKYVYHLDAATAERAYGNYLRFNDIANQYISRLKTAGVLEKDCLTHVHDYQDIGVKGDVFSYHIPFPPLSYLKKVVLPVIPSRDDPIGGEKPLLETRWFRDSMDRLAKNYDTITFQRPSDQENFLALLAYLHPSVAVDNPAEFPDRKLDDREALAQVRTASPALSSREARLAVTTAQARTTSPQPVGEDSACEIAVRFPTGDVRHVKLLNIPVGISQEQNLNEARQNEHALNKTRFTASALSEACIKLPEKTAPTIRNILGPMLDDKSQKIFLSVHRNDYSKSTLKKLEAAELFLKEHPKAAKDTHFVFLMEPSRKDIEAYRVYGDAVMNKARELRKQYGDAFVVIEQKIDHGDVMGLMRQDNVVGFMGVGMKDGHDLTVREAIDSRADHSLAHFQKHPLSIVLTDGLGASEALGGTKEKPGAFIVPSSEDTNIFVRHLADTLAEIDAKNRIPQGRRELADRCMVMKESSKHYTGKLFGEAIHGLAMQKHIGVPFTQNPLLPSTLVTQSIVQDRRLSPEPAGYGITAKPYQGFVAAGDLPPHHIALTMKPTHPRIAEAGPADSLRSR